MKFTMTDIRAKERPELEKTLKESREELRHLKAKVGAQDLKNVRSIRNLRQVISRVSTRLTELKVIKTN